MKPFTRILLALLATAGLLAMPAATSVIRVAPATITVAGVDAHDGTIYQDGTSYYLAGTSYDCGFTWGTANTPWCGFDVYTASSPVGPWTLVRELFNRAFNSPFHNQTWQSLCGGTGGWGCFNPRMVQRPSDGKWVLSFNAPGDLAKYNANGYYFMTCDGPAGPCGNGSATGATNKPALYICNAAEDFSIVVDGTNAYIVCVARDRSLSIEKLDAGWINGINVGATNLGGLTFVEGVDIYHDTDAWIMTFGSNCAYCIGIGTDYAFATSVTGPYAVMGATRRRISGHSCGGQSRTVFELDGVIYQGIDTWYGPYNETDADYLGVPLRRTGAPLTVTANGSAWLPPFEEFVCA